MLQSKKGQSYALVVSMFLVSISAMIYEFSIITALVFILGRHVYIFVILIGLFLTALGAGTYLGSKKLKNCERQFLGRQLWLATLGLFCLPIVFFVYAFIAYSRRSGTTISVEMMTVILWVVSSLLVILVGLLTGSTLPALATYLGKKTQGGKALGLLLGYDYTASLIGALIFPFLLYPLAGLFRAHFIGVLINLFAYLLATVSLPIRSGPVTTRGYQWVGGLLIAITIVLLFLSPSIETTIDHIVYGGK